MRSPRSGRSSREPISGAQPQPSRCSVALTGPRALALGPVGIVEHRQQPLGDRLEHGRGLGFAAWRLEPESLAQSRRRRHREPRRVEEGEQLEQVEAAEIGIAEPLPDQRRIEDDVRGLGRPGDGFAPARLAHGIAFRAITARQPNPGVGRVQRWYRQGGHRLVLRKAEHKWNAYPSG